MNTQQYLDLFESQETKERGQWWSFKLEVINPENKLYNKMTDMLRESELDEDSRYRFTIEALEAIKDKGEVTAKHELEEIDSYAEAPIYTSELMEWVAKGTNYTFVDEAVQEFGWNEGLVQAISIAYSEAWKEHYFKVLEIVKS